MEDLKKLTPHFNTQEGSVPSVFSLERVKISDNIFRLLHPLMNEIHGTDFSFRFWKIVLNEYVNSAISIKHILEKDEWQGIPSLLPINSHHIPTTKDRIMARLPAVVKHYKTLGTLNKINSVISQNNHISIGLPGLDIVQKETGYPIPLYYPIYPGTGNNKKRKKVSAIAERYSDRYEKNIIKRLPKIFVEYFNNEINRIQLFEPASKTFHVHGMPPLFNTLLIAKYAENGAKLFCYQHGAYYGELVGHNSYLHESSLADEYRTWGWKIQQNDVPWKAYRLEKFKLQYANVAKSMQYDFLMCYPDLFYENSDFYKAGTEYFLNNISKEKYNNLLARPRPMHRLFSHANRLAFIKDTRVTIDSGMSSMADVMGKCKLVIQFSIPATNFFECLYVDHPTIGLLDNDQPTDIIKPYYDFLKKHGVLHENFVSLVNHLNKIELDDWWASVIKEPMYTQFKNEFLRKV